MSCSYLVVIASGKGKVVFDQVIANVESLRTIQSSDTISKIQHGLKEFSSIVDVVVKELNINREALNNSRQEASQRIQAVSEKQLECENESKSITVQLASLDSHIGDIARKKDQLTNQLEVLKRRKAEEDKKREQAVFDYLIPGAGIIGGFFEGNYKRMIPLHSQIEGLISVFKQESESLSKSIRQQYDEIENLQRRRELLVREESKLHGRRASYDREAMKASKEARIASRNINQLGKKINILLKVKQELERIKQESNIKITSNVDNINILIEIDELHTIDIDNLSNSLRILQGDIWKGQFKKHLLCEELTNVFLSLL